MHNLHFILIKADSAAKAVSEAESLILDWGNENNWRCVGGIASEDGSDDVENHDEGAWGLAFLDKEEGVPKEGTYFSRAVAYLHREIAEPLAGLPSKLLAFSGTLRAFDPERGPPSRLEKIGRDLQHLSEHMVSRGAREGGEEIPQLYEWKFDRDGLTDMTDRWEGSRRYILFLDMHS